MATKLKRTKLPVFLLFAGWCFTGCGHTNDLANYEVRGKGMLFQNHVAPEARQIKIEFSESPGDKGIIGVITSVGSEIISAENKRKLINSVDTRLLAVSIANGFQKAVETYLDVQTVESVDENPNFITDVTLEDCRLIASANGVQVNVRAAARFIDKRTGGLVWEYKETETVPLRNNAPLPDRELNKIGNVFSAMQLANMSEEELNNAVSAAAEEVGNMIGETLRQDIADSHK